MEFYERKKKVHVGKLCFYFCRMLGLFFEKDFYKKKNLSTISSECQIVWIQIWVQIVFKSFQQTTIAGKEFIIMTENLCDKYHFSINCPRFFLPKFFLDHTRKVEIENVNKIDEILATNGNRNHCFY